MTDSELQSCLKSIYEVLFPIMKMRVDSNKGDSASKTLRTPLGILNGGYLPLVEFSGDTRFFSFQAPLIGFIENAGRVGHRDFQDAQAKVPELVGKKVIYESPCCDKYNNHIEADFLERLIAHAVGPRVLFGVDSFAWPKVLIIDVTYYYSNRALMTLEAKFKMQLDCLKFSLQ